jgi:hypothetical protein
MGNDSRAVKSFPIKTATARVPGNARQTANRSIADMHPIVERLLIIAPKYRK